MHFRKVIPLACISAGMIGAYICCNVRNHGQEVIERNRLSSVLVARRCSEDGMRNFKDFFAEAHDNSYQRWDTPEFHFNSRLNSCLVYIRYVQYLEDPTLRTFHHNYIIDVYSNRHVVHGYFQSDPGLQPTNEKLEELGDGVPNYDSRKFSTEKGKLFSE